MGDCLAALNGLEAPRASAALAPVPARRAVATADVQVAAIRRIRAAVSRVWPPPDALERRGALKVLLEVDDLRSRGEGSVRETLDLDRVKILQSQLSPKHIEDVAPPHLGDAFRDSHRHIERATCDLESERPPMRPYCSASVDPGKKASRPQQVWLLRRMATAGLIGARLWRRADVGLFFLRKKDGRQRLIVDARQANWYHRQPPRSNMGSVESMGSLDCSLVGMGGAEAAPSIFATAAISLELVRWPAGSASTCLAQPPANLGSTACSTSNRARRCQWSLLAPCGLALRPCPNAIAVSHVPYVGNGMVIGSSEARERPPQTA